MKNKNIIALTLVLLLLLISLTSCDALPMTTASEEEDAITASGVVEAIEVSVSSELSGRIVEIYVSEGNHVEAGDPLYKLNDELLKVQKNQAQAQLESAHTALQGAEAALIVAQSVKTEAEIAVEAAKIGYELAINEARALEAPERVAAWNESLPNLIELPAWYFHNEEKIAAAELTLESYLEDYETEQKNFEDVIQDIGHEKLIAAEKRLAKAQASFMVAESLRDHKVGSEGKAEIDDYTQTLYDVAETELKAAQEAYNNLLSGTDAEDLLEIRSRLTVTQEQYELALDQLQALQTGEDSLPVRAAQITVKQAEAAVDRADAQIAQAEASLEAAKKGIAQAEAALDLINLQIEKLTVYAPVDGVILTRNIEPGEVTQAGTSALIIGQLDELTVTVYIPENRYGQIQVGDTVQLNFDSFPGESFEGEVIRIADQAEYTPRNVQTQEERQKTVYAVKLSVKDPQGKLKPGMPTDVIFTK